ncbi:MAG: hypothetical protein HY094_07120 [Candidatus Melainabacteria bacterium]|nr:hypothetical protein [Candidatus Melainabacteria bacterium]
MNSKLPFQNFQVDHMTLLVKPKMYNIVYLIFRIIFGVSREDIIYEKRKEWAKGKGEVSMTFAVRIGKGLTGNASVQNTIIALVQPSEPNTQPSHVREMLDSHSASAHWQHIALRTPDLLSFHQFALEHGVNFITPILKDDDEDLIQVFSGEWYLPGDKPSGMFFEFVQRDPSEALLKKLEEHNRESWFRDKTFLGLYGEKEKEYQSGIVIPFLDHKLSEKLLAKYGSKHVWEISEDDLKAAKKIMIEHAKSKQMSAKAV